jgi:hypothetical protein
LEVIGPAGVVAIALDEHREERGHHGGHEFGLRIAVQLLERFDDRRQHRNPAALADAVHVQELDHERDAIVAHGRDARPIGGLKAPHQRVVPGVAVKDVIGDNRTILIQLNAVPEQFLILAVHRAC